MENRTVYNAKEFEGRIILISTFNEVDFVCYYNFYQYDSIQYRIYKVDYLGDGEYLMDNNNGYNPVFIGLFRWKGCWDHRIYFPEDNEFDVGEVFEFTTILKQITNPLRIAMKDRTPQWIDDSDVNDPNY